MTPNPARRLLLLALAYAAFVAYGSLIPFEFRPRVPDALEAFARIPYLQLGVASRADWVANILLYVPLGFLLAGAAAGARSRAGRVAGTAAAILFCLALAVALEFAQLFFPRRTVSQNDLIAEAIGTGLGVALWVAAGRRMLDLARQVSAGGAPATRAAIILYVVAYLGFSLFPYDFLVSATELAAKLGDLGPSAWVLSDACGGVLRCNAKLFAEILLAAPIGVLYGMLRGRDRPAHYAAALAWGLALGLLIEALQIFLASGISQGVSVLTRGLGAVWGLVVYRFVTGGSFTTESLVRHRRTLRTLAWLAAPPYLAALLVLKGLVPLRPESAWATAEKLEELRFLPFYYHYFTTETEAMQSLLLNAGLYVPIGLLVWITAAPGRDRSSRWIAAAAGAGVAFGVETLALFTVGKRPDPTNVLIAAATAYGVALVAQWLEHGFPRGAASSAPRPQARARRKGTIALALATATIALAVAIGGLMIATPEREKLVDERTLPRLPRGQDLPPATLPGFRFAHPRLPHPAARDIAVLRARNPGFLAAQKRAADRGQGRLEAAILTELVEPGSQDLALVVQRLLESDGDWRVHRQARPLVLAYDWLYGRFSDEQRAALQDKVAEACNQLIEVVRTERLSPYNVALYRGWLQTLVACSIALYRDDPRGEPVMRFTHDYWTNRVLPVWRQVMGRNGGWHEGGGYVAMGIGQAIYEVPAMWRHATGEDLFASEPGIRGFADFLVYRTQPDGSHSRWGDGASLDRGIPDAIPLALELRHAAAYTLQRPPREPRPSAWPWGPLTDATLVDPGAVRRLPLARHFDGIGVLVARSDWSPGATYVTFKAGDNYWSHVHLDQGAFTIYKGGPLAIDSGADASEHGYGSDHHLNYAYQTIAHNTLTVTDPADTVPAPGRSKPRPIANDGGQRRVGSGWGVEAAPLDRAEWESKRDTYHTGRIERLLEQDGIVVATADLAPAYTNALSGKATFSHRTRRVERFRRTFGYDRIDDVVVVFDDVTATQASFRKRWLLHAIERPRVAGNRFTVSLPAAPKRGWAGGQLEGHVLLPPRPVLAVVGGPGAEFVVGDRNYDEGGTLRELIRGNAPDAGAWRIELSPEVEAREDVFLVVMLPSALGRAPAHVIRPLQEGTYVGCEVVGPNRTTRWLFDRERGLVALTITKAR